MSISAEKEARHKILREILSRNRIVNQPELLDLLAVEGIISTQATLSRDLRELGVRKSDAGWVVSSAGPVERVKARLISTEMRRLVQTIERSGTFVVLAVAPEDTDRVAGAIRALQMPEIVGVATTRETILIPCTTATAARRVQRQLAGSR